jgi:hypothetical protein
VNPKSLLGILIILGGFISVLIYYGNQHNPFAVSNSSRQNLTRNETWTYDPPIYLCRLVQIATQDTLKSAQEAGVITNWLTVGGANGPPQPTAANPNIMFHSGLAEKWIDLEPGSTYFFDQCLGPYHDNTALCNAVKSQNLLGDVVNAKQNDCRIFIRLKQ